jgi:aminoglycoside 6-adenylyltransferase
MPEGLIRKIIEWSSTQESIRVLILEGSRAHNTGIDLLSDYDINVFAKNPAPYLCDNKWLETLDRVWVCVPAEITAKGRTFSSRLVIFRNGVKVDFIFYTLDILREFAEAETLPEQYDIGYRILLDKDNITKDMLPPSFQAFLGHKPTEEEFVACVNGFWFEAYHVAKYIKRNDLWLVKFRDWSTKLHLIKMIRWNEGAIHRWTIVTHPLGKDMKSWVSSDTWDALHKTFAHFDVEDSWSALHSMLKLFRRLGTETAKLLGFPYNHNLDRNITNWIEAIRE